MKCWELLRFQFALRYEFELYGGFEDGKGFYGAVFLEFPCSQMCIHSFIVGECERLWDFAELNNLQGSLILLLFILFIHPSVEVKEISPTWDIDILQVRKPNKLILPSITRSNKLSKVLTDAVQQKFNIALTTSLLMNTNNFHCRVSKFISPIFLCDDKFIN